MCRSIVTYFSITGVTEDVAQRLAEAIGADLMEIKAEQPSQDALAQSSDHDFCSQDSAAAEEEPRIVCKKQDLDCYDTIFVGLPIWWYAAPTVINNFLDDYDLTGKIVVPFATSGGGGIDRVRPRLQKSCEGADLKEASLLPGELSTQELAQWAADMVG